MSNDTFPIDLLNPDDIREKRPQIEALLADRRRELETLQKQVELLERLVEPSPRRRTTGRAKQPTRPRSRPGRAPMQDLAVKALERAGHQMGPASLFKFMEREEMEGPPNANALGASLYAAWKAGRVKKATNGLYAPLEETGSTTIDHPIADYDALPPDSPFPAPPANNS